MTEKKDFEKVQREDGTFAAEGKARFLNDDDILNKILDDFSKALIKEEERKDRFKNALEEAIKKEPEYNIYKNGNISLKYDKADNLLYFSFRLKNKEERVYLRKDVSSSIMSQIAIMRECAFRNINNMIWSLDYGKDDFRLNYYHINWSFREMRLVKKECRDWFVRPYNCLDIQCSDTTYFNGTKEAYRKLFKWKVLMIAYDRLLEWISDNEDKIKEVGRKLSK